MDRQNTVPREQAAPPAGGVDLRGKTAVVTGGSGVLCSCMARALGACGARVAVLARGLGRAEAVAEEIVRAGGEAMAVACDATDKASLEAARSAVLARFGTADILVNGAGGNRPAATTDDEFYGGDAGRTFFDLEERAIREVFDVNSLSALLATQVFARGMARGGCVVNVSSMNAFRPLTKIPAYSAAKSALSNLTMWLAAYFAAAGIRVNAIAPGFFVTEQNRALLYAADGTPTPRTEKILAATPMRRFGEPEELLGALMFLVDPRASGFVTGVVLPVDGGFSVYSGV